MTFVTLDPNDAVILFADLAALNGRGRCGDHLGRVRRRTIGRGFHAAEGRGGARRSLRDRVRLGGLSRNRLCALPLALSPDAHVQSKDLLRLPDAAERVAAEGFEAAVAAYRHGGELLRDQNGPAERLA
jgi:hypothetical protein